MQDAVNLVGRWKSEEDGKVRRPTRSPHGQRTGTSQGDTEGWGSTTSELPTQVCGWDACVGSVDSLEGHVQALLYIFLCFIFVLYKPLKKYSLLIDLPKGDCGL